MQAAWSHPSPQGGCHGSFHARATPVIGFAQLFLPSRTQGIACACRSVGSRRRRLHSWDILWPDQALRSVKRAVCDCDRVHAASHIALTRPAPARAMRDLTLSSGKAETLPVCHGMLGLLAGNMPHPPGPQCLRCSFLDCSLSRLTATDYCIVGVTACSACLSPVSPCIAVPFCPVLGILSSLCLLSLLCLPCCKHLAVEPARPAFSTR